MRVLIVLSLIAIASADQLGYNYQPVGHSASGLSFIPGLGSNSGPGIGNGLVNGNGQGGGHNNGFNNGNIGLSNGLGNSLGKGLGNVLNNNGFGTSNVGSGDLAGPLSYNVPAQPEYSKEFFTFSAPEQDFDNNPQAQLDGLTKKNLRVVFIKAPENKNLENAVLNLAQQASHQKTAIYVLQKQPDINDLANKLNNLRNDNNGKPEVHFVKYRTPEDAANAQRLIQMKYDSLGGSSRNHDAGVAPVINFASQGPAIITPAPQAPGNSYLPSSIFRKRV